MDSFQRKTVDGAGEQTHYKQVIFAMACLDKDVVAVMSKRVFEITSCFRRIKGHYMVKVMLNGKQIELKSFSQFVDRYLTPAKERYVVV
ncbi:hypothetical protein HID58_068842 [Brassica napus]|uniref:(rape) hypothetical protein n=1 Tax=Brassica napus TaxID=3708 RepID=A0A816LYI0_BRANA|nr:hypothetical protein HID58_068842 [Brassica napus]CAF1937672.1 unnamed protein product [Brassica napus]